MPKGIPASGKRAKYGSKKSVKATGKKRGRPALKVKATGKKRGRPAGSVNKATAKKMGRPRKTTVPFPANVSVENTDRVLHLFESVITRLDKMFELHKAMFIDHAVAFVNSGAGTLEDFLNTSPRSAVLLDIQPHDFPSPQKKEEEVPEVDEEPSDTDDNPVDFGVFDSKGVDLSILD